MRGFAPWLRVSLWLTLVLLLGMAVQRAPGRVVLSQPHRGIDLSVPRNLEGWRLEPGEGNLLATGRTRTGWVSLEIVDTAVALDGDLDGYIAKRHQELKAGRSNYRVWHHGEDAKFGMRPAPAYKATYDGQLVGPLKTETWQYDVYWPYRGRYARISMRYPNFMANYVFPDRLYIAAGLRLEP